MKSANKQIAVTAIILIFLLTSLFAYADDKLVLPKKIGDWKISDDVQVYEGNDLYLYINGGAELYHEYGFLYVTATDYLLGEDSIAVEIYHLDKSAFGLYSLLRDTDGKKIDAGQEGSFSDYYLLFWQGNDLVAVTAHSDKGNDAAILSGIAKELAPALSKDAEIPEYVKVLPQEGIQANSLKYVVGSIGLLNSYPNLAKYFFKFTQGVSASYADGSSVLVLSWKTAAEAKAAMENAVRITAKEDNEKDNIAKSGDDFLLTLGKDSLKAKLKDEKIIFKK